MSGERKVHSGKSRGFLARKSDPLENHPVESPPLAPFYPTCQAPSKTSRPRSLMQLLGPSMPVKENMERISGGTK